MVRRRLASVTLALSAYTLSIVLLASVSLLLIPAMIRASGVAAWADIAVGQAIGALAAIVVSFGWALSGPAAIASGSDGVRRGVFWQSLFVRGLLLPPVSAFAAALAYILSPGHTAFAVAASLSTSVQGLTTRWYFVGVGRPLAMIVGDTLPRVGGTAVGIVLMTFANASALVGLMGQFAGVIFASAATAAIIAYWTRNAHTARTPLRGTWPEHIRNTGTNLIGSVYSASSVVVIGIVAHPILPVYALYDRFLSQGVAGLTPIGQVLQGWVPKVHGYERKRRAIQAARLSIGLAVPIIILVSAAAEPLLNWLGDGEIPVSRGPAILVSVLLGLSVIESVVSRAGLIALGAAISVSRITVAGIVFGVGLLILGVKVAGLTGAIVGLIVGMLIRCGWLLAVLVRFDPESSSSNRIPT